MKKLLTGICSLLLVWSVFGQQIKSQPAGFDDYRVLLQAAGFEVFSFDLEQFLQEETRYDITIRIKEYESGKMIYSEDFPCGPNKLLLTDFPEDSRGDIAPEQMDNPVAGVYRQAEKVSIGFYPSGVDSTKMLKLNIPDMTEASRVLKLRSVTAADGSTLTSYRTRPFRIDSFEPGKFIPLVFCGSMWYDAEGNFFRFCGESEIAPDLSSEIVGYVPHFYVIGIEVSKNQEL